LSHAGLTFRGAFVIVISDELVTDFDKSMDDVDRRKRENTISLGLAPVMAAFIQVSRIQSVGFLRI
jgi:hypothetical protein